MALEPRPQQKQYDYLLKFLLVGDSDVGKQEILSGLEDGSSESPFCSGSGMYRLFMTCLNVHPFLCLLTYFFVFLKNVCPYLSKYFSFIFHKL